MTAPTLDQLQPGDTVILKRNLDHPAWMKEVAADPRSGSTTHWVRDDSVEEMLGTSTILERRDIPGTHTGWRDRKAQSLVRLANGFWYDLAAGLQDKSEATRIELIQPRG